MKVVQGQRNWLFWSEGTFDIRFWHKKYVFPEKKQKVKGGQKSQTGSSGVNRYADYNGPTFNPNGHLVFELSPKNRFLTPNWPFMTLDHLTVLFENVPPATLTSCPKIWTMCEFPTSSYHIFYFWFFLPLTAPPEIVRAPKTIGHIYSLWAISTPPRTFVLCTVLELS